MAASSIPGIVLICRSNSRAKEVRWAALRYGSAFGLFGSGSERFAATTWVGLNPGFSCSRSSSVRNSKPDPRASSRIADERATFAELEDPEDFPEARFWITFGYAGHPLPMIKC